MAVTHMMANPKRVYTILHAVNLHTRMDPPLPKIYFRNIIRFAITTSSMDGMKERQCHALVNQMREAIVKIDGDYIKKPSKGRRAFEFIERAS